MLALSPGGGKRPGGGVYRLGRYTSPWRLEGRPDPPVGLFRLSEHDVSLRLIRRQSELQGSAGAVRWFERYDAGMLHRFGELMTRHCARPLALPGPSSAEHVRLRLSFQDDFTHEVCQSFKGEKTLNGDTIL